MRHPNGKEGTVRQLELIPLDAPAAGAQTKLELDDAGVAELVAAMVHAMLAVLREQRAPRPEEEASDER